MESAKDDWSTRALLAMNLGNSYSHLDSCEKAMKFYQEALKQYKIGVGNALHPGQADVYTNMGNAFYLAGDTKSAIQSLELAREIKEKGVRLAHTLINLGSFSMDAGLQGRAIECFRRAYPLLLKMKGQQHSHTQYVGSHLSRLQSLQKVHIRLAQLLLRFCS